MNSKEGKQYITINKYRIDLNVTIKEYLKIIATTGKKQKNSYKQRSYADDKCILIWGNNTCKDE